MENILHGATMREGALSPLPIVRWRHLPSLAFMCVEEKNQLLLNDFPLFRILSANTGRTELILNGNGTTTGVLLLLLLLLDDTGTGTVHSAAYLWRGLCLKHLLLRLL